MIINNESKNVSRNTKRRINRRNKINDDMKLLLSKIKSEENKKIKILDEIKQSKILLVRIKYVNKNNKLQSALKELKKFKLLMKIYTKLKMKYY